MTSSRPSGRRDIPVPKLLALGLQHVLVMYASAVAVPLIVGRALHLSQGQMAILINADLFACGIATLIQTVGFPGVGIRLPMIMGVTFGVHRADARDGGDARCRLARHLRRRDSGRHFRRGGRAVRRRLLPLFPPVVTGTIIMVIGVALMRVGVNWAGGGLPMLQGDSTARTVTFANPAYGELGGPLRSR